mmetsp:Transcript_57130/g.116270  ORF Transcript_57130/g.116270 Transcript_57130/m.116270 type:complete len:240 (+) Transcript_57130:540-1259(+)
MVFQPIQTVVDGGHQRRLFVFRQFSFQRVGDRVFQVVQIGLQVVAGLYLGLFFRVFLGKFLGLSNHGFDVLLGKPALFAGDGERLLFAGALVVGTDAQNTIGVHVEAHLDLGNTTGCRGNARELKLPQEPVGFRHAALSLEDLDVDTGLVVGVGRKYLGFLDGNCGPALDQGRHDPARCFDAQRKRGNVQQEDVLGRFGGIPTQDSTLNRGTIGLRNKTKPATKRKRFVSKYFGLRMRW